MKGFREGFSLGRRGGERPGGGARDSEPRPAEVLVKVDDWELMIITCLMTRRAAVLSRRRRHHRLGGPHSVLVGISRDGRRAGGRGRGVGVLLGVSEVVAVAPLWARDGLRVVAVRARRALGPAPGSGRVDAPLGATPPPRGGRAGGSLLLLLLLPPRGSLRARARRDPRARRGDGLGGDGHVPREGPRDARRAPRAPRRARARRFRFRLRRRRGDDPRRRPGAGRFGLVLLGRFRSRRSRRSRRSARRRLARVPRRRGGRAPRRSGRAGRRAPDGALGVRSRAPPPRVGVSPPPREPRRVRLIPAGSRPRRGERPDDVDARRRHLARARARGPRRGRRRAPARRRGDGNAPTRRRRTRVARGRVFRRRVRARIRRRQSAREEGPEGGAEGRGRGVPPDAGGDARDRDESR